ncbi:hypothetical protein MC885_000916 [Smutsia gigantea]|nr:hypothetical protein MC885_000916 [Smutsia gigantea]
MLRIKSSLGWPLTVWTRWFTGPTSMSLPLGGPVCLVESQASSFDKILEAQKALPLTILAATSSGQILTWIE